MVKKSCWAYKKYFPPEFNGFGKMKKIQALFEKTG